MNKRHIFLYEVRRVRPDTPSTSTSQHNKKTMEVTMNLNLTLTVDWNALLQQQRWEEFFSTDEVKSEDSDEDIVEMVSWEKPSPMMPRRSQRLQTAQKPGEWWKCK